MKEIPLSLCEKTSLISNLESNIRHDGRKFQEIRPIEILFGKDYGNCMVILGETRVLSQVTCEIVEPRPSRPNEGRLSIGIHLSPMAASHFEPGKGLDIVDDLQQILDRNIKESRCVDLESLCIMAEENVWHFKVDVTVLNHAGNLADACNLSAVSALRHFHRPDVTVGEDGRMVIHTKEERDLIPTFLKKIPVCLTYALFDTTTSGCITILDPTEKEERVMSGKLIIGLNPHGEITSLIFPGKVCIEKHFIMNCISRSYLKAKSIAEMVMKRVEDDIEQRKSGTAVNGYLNTLKSDSEYSKNNILDRMEHIRDSRTMKIEKEVQDKDILQEELATPMNIEDNQGIKSEELRGVSNIDSTHSSDEEFSQEVLSMTLPQIKAEKKAKGNKKKKKSGSKSNIKDEEMDTSSCKLDINDL